MTRADAKKAIDEALADGLKKAFGNLTQHLMLKDAKAEDEFKVALGFNLRAHEIATAIAEKTFKD